MAFLLRITAEARAATERFRHSDPHRALRVEAALVKLERDPKHPGLKTHPYAKRGGPNKEIVWESYAENHTANAYRLLWYYNSDERNVITVVNVIEHP